MIMRFLLIILAFFAGSIVKFSRSADSCASSSLSNKGKKL